MRLRLILLITLIASYAFNSAASSHSSAKPLDNKARSWTAIKKSGELRAIKLDWEFESRLPRSGSSSQFHIEKLSQFAHFHKLKIKWVSVKNLEAMFEQLRQHNVDIIPRHLTITKQRQQFASFTIPLLKDREVLVGKKGTKVPDKKSAAVISLPEKTAYIESINKHYPDWKIKLIKGTRNSEQIADELVNGSYQYSVLDGQSVKTLLSYRQDIEVLFKLPGTTRLAWAVSKNNDSLLDKLNEFIAVHHVSYLQRGDRTYDLKTIKDKGLPLRVITRNSPETYFLWRGELMGFEYELMREFAKRHQLNLEMIVASSYEEMLQLLNDGKGDVIAAAVSRTNDRKKSLTFSIRYNRIDEQLVANKNSPPIKQLEDLKGRTLVTRKSSAFWPTAKMLSEKYGATLIAADEKMATELLIEQVDSQSIDLTIADSNLLAIEKKFRENLVTPLTLNEDIPYAYVVRKKNPLLLAELNRYLKSIYRNTFYNVVKSKYFSDSKRLKKHRKSRIVSDSSLSPYDALVQKKSRKYKFDWRLITSQMYEESRFNPSAKAYTGATGLMQVLPTTAKELGISDLLQPEQAIAAGVQYLNWSRDRFPTALPVQERLFFALASYNAGYGHVKDAQRLAKELKLNPGKWFNHVEKAMLLLQKPEYYKKTRFGYCRGSEPVNYVRNIYQRYLSYVKITQ